MLAAIAGWLAVSHRHPCEVVVHRLPGLLLGTAVLLYVSGVALAVTLLLKRRLQEIAWGIGLLVALGALGILQSRYTELGIFALGGGDYWVGHAAEATEPEKKICALRVALEGTQYALNTVENELVDDYADRPKVQAELFGILASIAPNDNWHAIYEARQQDALKRLSSGGDVPLSELRGAGD